MAQLTYRIDRLLRFRTWMSFLLVTTATLALAACNSDTPVHDHALPTATPDAVAAAPDLTSPDFQIPYLASSAGMWHASVVLDNATPRTRFAASMMDSITRLGLGPSADQLNAANSGAEAERLIEQISTQIEAMHGQRALALFAVEYHTTAAAELLASGPDLRAPDEQPGLRYQAGLHLVDAISAVTRMGLSQALIQEGQQLALPLLSQEESQDAPSQIEAWAKAAIFAYQGQPTPMPPPALEDQAGTDITAALPPGNRFRGEVRHDQLGCSACHLTDAVAPQWRDFSAAGSPGLAALFETRWQDPNYTGQATSAVEYVIESTVLPDVYVVDGYDMALMSVDYSKQLSKQDLADLTAFLMAIGP